MQKEEQVRLLKLLMQRLDDDTNVDAGGMLKNPAEVYTCPDLAAAREREAFFRGYPQVVGMCSDLPDPGTRCC